MSPPLRVNDCFLHDKDRLRHDEALGILKERLPTVARTTTVRLEDALKRVVSAPVQAPHPIPLHTNSAVDGYAFCHSDNTGTPMPVTSRVAAGDLAPQPLEPGHAARIFTGATMPQGADSVAMQEDCTEAKEGVKVPTSLKPGANCRKAGEDLQQGEQMFGTGHRLDPADIAAAASIGLSEIPVFEKLRVALISSGNELRRADNNESTLQPGEVFDANSPLLRALLSPLPVDVTAFPIVGDSRADVQKTLANAAASHHVILTTGGASRGDEDHMLAVLDEIGKRHLWQLAVKPGRPMMFGQIARADGQADCFHFGLPGNPVAAMVCFLLYARPSLLKLAGADWDSPPRFPLPAAFEIQNKKPDRREFLRGILQRGEDGSLAVDKFQRDGSGLISSLRMADGLIELPESSTHIARGTPVNFIPFSSFD